MSIFSPSKKSLSCPRCGVPATSGAVSEVWACSACDRLIPDPAAKKVDGRFLCPECEVPLSVLYYCLDCLTAFNSYGSQVVGYKWRRTLWDEAKDFCGDLLRAARATVGL